MVQDLSRRFLAASDIVLTMLHFNHRSLIIFSGAVWFVVGSFLLQLGLRLLMGTLEPEASFSSMLHFVSHRMGSIENAVILLITIGLIVGFFKGRVVLAKSVNRLVTRIRSFHEPTPIAKIYTLPYYILLASMMMIGMLIKYFQVPDDIRGTVDVAIGAALINGAMLYFRAAFSPSQP